MTLRLKINLIVGTLTLLFLLAVMGLQWRSLRESVNEEVVAANRVATQLLNRTAWLYAAQGTAAMLDFLQGVGRVRSNDILLYGGNDDVLYTSPPSPYKAGRDAPEWFTHLIAPQAQEQAIQFPAGRLVVRANASRAVLDAWDDLVRLTGAAAAVLLAVHAVLYVLVGRTTQPFQRIVQALQSVQAGRLDVSLPPLPGREAGAIGQAFNRMVGELQRQRETESRALRAESELSDSRALARWIDQRIERERRMIARELHDEFGQSVTAMRSMALSIAQRVEAQQPQAAQAARLIADESSRLYEAMHGIIPRLAPLVLDSFGLADALGDLAERTRRSHPGLQLTLSLSLGETTLDADRSLMFYRAAQEGITNALRHGQATALSLTLEADAEQARLTLQDNGRGLDPATGPGAGPETGPGHYGLRWLAERVHDLEGQMQLDNHAPPTGGTGARLRVSVPLPPAPMPELQEAK